MGALLYPLRHKAGPCITNVIATCRKNFSQWESSFLWKLRCHWLKFLRRVAKTLVIQGPDVEAKVGFLSWPRRCYVSATSESVHATNPNPLKLSFSIEMWDNSLTYTLDTSLVIIILCKSAIHTPKHAASLSHTVHQLSIADDDVTYVHFEHISRSECII